MNVWTRCAGLLMVGFALPISGSAATIDFDEVPSGSFASYSESGFTVTPLDGLWSGSHYYGNPLPFITFWGTGDAPVAATIVITSHSGWLLLSAFDVYSSITVIPHLTVGYRRDEVVFSLEGTVPNTYGGFATVDVPWSSMRVDRVHITLTNPETCCINPMGLDNLVVVAVPVPEPPPLLLLLLGTLSLFLGLRRVAAQAKYYPGTNRSPKPHRWLASGGPAERGHAGGSNPGRSSAATSDQSRTA